MFSYARGFAPCIPATEPEAALIVPAEQVPKGGLNLRFSAKTKGDGSLWAKPAAKERGDRGRGTSAFEMVLSPGAGRASAAGVQPPSRCRQRPPNRQRWGHAPLRAPQRLGKQVPPGFKPRGCKGRSPLHKITLSLPLPAGKGGGGMGVKKQAKGGVSGRQRKQAPRRGSAPSRKKT